MFYHYIQSILRNVKKNRFFYTINLIGFLIGFLVLTIISTFVYQELSFDRFHKNANSIFRIHSGGYGVTPLCLGEKLKNQLPEITGIVRFSSDDLKIVQQNKEVSIGHIFYTDADIFKVFSFKLLSGNINTVLKTSFSIVINQSSAIKLFGKRSPIGESIRDNKGVIYNITGVMADIPYNSHIQANAFISIETLRQTGDENTFSCGSWSNLTYISLSNNHNYKETENKLNVILKDSRMNNIPLQLQKLTRVYFDYDNNKFDGCRHGNLQTLVIYLAISILILFIVVINYINLFTAISGGRIKEIAIRKLNGAKSIQIVKQILLESIFAAIISYIVAISTIEFLLPQLSSLLNLTISESLDKSFLYLCYFIGVAIIGLITGLASGIALSKISGIKILKNESFFSSRGIQRKVLLLIQLLIVAILLNSTFIIKKQINYVLRKDLGINTENVVCINLDSILINKGTMLRNSLLYNPGIQSVSFSSCLIGDGFSKAPFGKQDDSKLCCFYSVDPDYFSLYGIKIKSGRYFSRDLKTDFDKCCIVNEKACRDLEFTNPIGELLNNRQIIGIVKDFNYSSLHNKIEPLIIKCGNTGNVLQMRISPVNQDKTLDFIMKTCKSISPTFEGSYSFLDNRINELYRSELDLKRSFEIYAIITLIIALLGLFGLTLFTVKKKIKEVSIRKLYGARLKDTIKLLTNEQIIIVVISNILAIPITYLIMNKWLSNFQYKIDMGILIYLKTLLITIVFTLLTVLLLIIKTHRLNLIETLKYE
jgi:putative ABC transport system permease protein